MRRLTALVLVLVVMAAGCGDDSTGATEAPATTGATGSTAAETTTTAVATTTTAAETTTTVAPIVTIPVRELAFDPLPDTTVWVTFADGTLGRVDATTAELQASVQVGPVDALEVGLGAVWLVSCEQQALISVSQQTVAETGRWDLGACPSDLAVADGAVLVALADADAVVSVDPLSGEIEIIVEIEAPTSVDAGSPVLVGTADGQVALWDRSPEGSFSHEWTTHLAGNVFGVIVNDFWWPDIDLYVMVIGPDGRPFIVVLDADTGEILDSWDPDLFEVFSFLVWADWVFAAGGLPGRVWDVARSGGDPTSTEVPMLSSIAGVGTPMPGVPPQVVAVGGDGESSSLYTVPTGGGPATEVGELAPVPASLAAAAPPPLYCPPDHVAETRQHIARMAAEADAIYSEKAADLNTNAGTLYQQANDLVDRAPQGSEARKEATLAAGGAADAQMSYEIMNGDAFTLYRLSDTASKSCDPQVLRDIEDVAETTLQKIEDRYREMEDSLRDGFRYLASAEGKL
ncbi:MAG: hypothetical protein KJ698_07160 [Actinobacteria bacterium]|nr:hypothetical protein [Actinomycetota bacterium]